jgi:hypothetical protein
VSIYVERLGDRYRWSPSHRGGPYPLHRVVGRIIDVPYTSFALPFVTVDDRAVVRPEDEAVADGWTWLDDAGHDVTVLHQRIEAMLGLRESVSDPPDALP